MNNKYINVLLNLIFPSRCLFCKELLAIDYEYYLCNNCAEILPFNNPPYCPICGRHFPLEGKPCIECSGKKFYFDNNYAPLDYSGLSKKIIRDIKYRSKKHYIFSIFKFITIPEQVFKDVECIVAVPLHKSRLKQRGYNQALLIARELHNLSNIPLETNWIIRTKKTKTQYSLTGRARMHNMRGSFSLISAHKYKSVLLVDDIYTTGSTINEVARILKESGVNKVTAFSLNVVIKKPIMVVNQKRDIN